MRIRPAVCAAAAAISLGAFAIGGGGDSDVWFNGGVDTWPDGVTVENGQWDPATTNLASHSEVGIEVNAGDSALLFHADERKDFAENEITVMTKIRFSAFRLADLPPVPDGAKGAITLVDDGESLSFYGIGKSGDANAWLQLDVEDPDFDFAAVTNTFSAVYISLSVADGRTNVTYGVGASDLTFGGSSAIEIAVGETTAGTVGYMGSCGLQELIGTCKSETTAECMIGSTTYPTVADAIRHMGESDELVLLSDAVLDISADIPHTNVLTVANGLEHTLTIPNPWAYKVVVDDVTGKATYTWTDRPEAKIGLQYYVELSDAFKDASASNTVTLLDNVTVPAEGLLVTNSFVLDLGELSLSSESNVLVLADNADLTIRGSGIYDPNVIGIIQVGGIPGEVGSKRLSISGGYYRSLNGPAILLDSAGGCAGCVSLCVSNAILAVFGPAIEERVTENALASLSMDILGETFLLSIDPSTSDPVTSISLSAAYAGRLAAGAADCHVGKNVWSYGIDSIPEALLPQGVELVEYVGDMAMFSNQGLYGYLRVVVAKIADEEYETLSAALEAACYGDTVTVVGDASSETVAAKPGVAIAVADGASAPAEAGWTLPGDWYSLVVADDVVVGMELNDGAKPVVGGDDALSVGEDVVAIGLANAKPGLYYGVKASSALGGLDEAEPSGWTPGPSAPGPLVLAPDKPSASSGFFRVVVTDDPRGK